MTADRRDPDGAARDRVEQTTRELWQAAGSPAGRELQFRLQAEEELGVLSVAGEEDPLVAVGQLRPGALREEGER
jgi:hypothetical protein